jgi:myo-inositol 2-dehydrogenase/D-chiro-inositol 1-dehydrogenase
MGRSISPDAPVRVGLFGCGRMGAYQAGILSRLPNVELEVADTDYERAKELGRELDVASMTTPELNNRGQLDAAVIAVPATKHAKLILELARMGVPLVYSQKPLTSKLSKARELLAALEGYPGTKLVVGFQRRFDPGTIRARELFPTIGALNSVHVVMADPEPPPEAYLKTSGGLPADQSGHGFDELRYVTGLDVKQVYAVGSARRDPMFNRCDDVDTAVFILTLSDGTFATLECTRYNGAGYDMRMELSGTKRRIAVGLDDHTPLQSVEAGVGWPSGDPWVGFLNRYAVAYEREMAEVVRLAVLARAGSDLGESPFCTGPEALEVMRIARACRCSLEYKRVVWMGEIPGGKEQ